MPTRKELLDFTQRTLADPEMLDTMVRELNASPEAIRVMLEVTGEMLAEMTDQQFRIVNHRIEEAVPDDYQDRMRETGANLDLHNSVLGPDVVKQDFRDFIRRLARGRSYVNALGHEIEPTVVPVYKGDRSQAYLVGDPIDITERVKQALNEAGEANFAEAIDQIRMASERHPGLMVPAVDIHVDPMYAHRVSGGVDPNVARVIEGVVRNECAERGIGVHDGPQRS